MVNKKVRNIAVALPLLGMTIAAPIATIATQVAVPTVADAKAKKATSAQIKNEKAQLATAKKQLALSKRAIRLSTSQYNQTMKAKNTAFVKGAVNVIIGERIYQTVYNNQYQALQTKKISILNKGIKNKTVYKTVQAQIAKQNAKFVKVTNASIVKASAYIKSHSGDADDKKQAFKYIKNFKAGTLATITQYEKSIIFYSGH